MENNNKENSFKNITQTKAKKKNLKKEQKLLERESLEKSKKRKKFLKKSIRYSILILVLFSLTYVAFLLFNFYSPDLPNRFKEGNVHWHSKVSIFVCGEYRSLAHLGTEEHHIGLPLIHTHGDNLIHIEGEPITYEDITLGKFFKSIKIPFENNRIMEKVDSDKCLDLKLGKLKVFLNKKELNDPTSYSIKDNDEFEIRFE